MPNDVYVADSSPTRSVQYVYNPKKGVWEPITVLSAGNNSSPTDSTDNQRSSGTTSSSSPSKVDSKAKADSEYIKTEYGTLEGELVLRANPKTIRLQVGQTVKIVGVGKYLSGLYYISAVKRTIDNSQGYSHSFTLTRNGFGDSLKKPAPVDNTRPAEVKQDTSPALKVGDKVMFLTIEGNKYIYSNASEGVKVPKWVTAQVHTVDGVSSDGHRVRLKEIWSWTYVKFLKKV